MLFRSTWYHLVATCDGTNASIYVNGTLRRTSFVDTNYVATAAGTRIGSSICCLGSEDFTGLIDEVAIYDRALSSNEILASYNAGAGGNCPGGSPPQITAFVGTNVTISPGGTIAFQVSASGDGPLYYQWLYNGVPIPAATNTTLLLTNVQPVQAGRYSAWVGNPAGSVSSGSASIDISSSAPGTVYWASWSSNTKGSIATPGGTISIGYSGELLGLSSGYPSWEPLTTFADGTIVSNGPPLTGGMIKLQGGGNTVDRITFNTPVLNPVLSLWSLGNLTTTAYFVFSEAVPTLVSGGPSLEYGVGSSITVSGLSVSGNEGNGTVRFLGVFSALSWVNPTYEYYSGFTVGVQGLVSPAPLFTGLNVSGGSLNLSWSAMAGRSYQLQFKTNVTQVNWQNLSGTISATNYTASVSGPIGPDQQRYYRVILLP